MAELFDVNVPAVSKHLSNIFEEEELQQDLTISKMETVQMEGNRKVRREREFYNLDAIIAVGYRVNSKKATRFRQWATKTLKEYITKGFVLNDDILKNGKPFGKDYFDELLERIREIRASERRAYQKITDVFEQCSYDYDKNSDTTKAFYAFVQNKLHFAVTGIAIAVVITAGAFAPAIAVALVGSSFPGLSGAALTSACLAYLGGGAIAAGGLGMSGGTMAIVGGGAILGAGVGVGVGGAVSAVSIMGKKKRKRRSLKLK
jgi:hypothetical protein